MKLNHFADRTPLIFSILLLCAFLAACSSPEDKLAKHRKRAALYLEQNKYTEAIIELKNVLQLDPNDDRASYDLGEIYVKQRDEEKSFRYFSEAVRLNPGNMDARLRLGQIFLVARQIREARDAAHIILAARPDHAEAMLLLAGVQIQERNPRAAVKSLEKLIASSPRNPKPLRYLAHLQHVAGNLKKAEEHFLKAIELDASDRNTYLELSDIYLKMRMPEKAVAVMEKMARTPGNRISKMYQLAAFYEKNGNMQLAENTLRQAAAESPPETPRPYFELGAFYARTQSFAQAVTNLEKALSMDDKDLPALSVLADIHFRQKELKKSETAAKRILAVDPENAEGNLLMGKLLMLNSDFKNAYERFDICLSNDPRNARAYLYRAMCLLQEDIGDLPGQALFRTAAGYHDINSWNSKKALDDLQTALTLSPGMIDAKVALAELYLKNGEVENAKRHVSEILEKTSHTKALTLLSAIRLSEGDLAGAEAVSRKVLEADPFHAPSHVTLGLLYNTLGQENKALAYFEKALEINPLQFDALNYMVSLHMKAGRTKAAFKLILEHGQAAAGSSRASAFIEFLTGKIHLTTGDADTARSHFEACLKYNPDGIPAHEALARIEEMKGNLEGAVTVYETILEKDPGNLNACMRLSALNFSADRKSEAKKYLEKALKIKEDHAPAANDLAFLIAEERGDLTKALILARMAVGISPSNANYRDTLGWVYYRQANFFLAISELKESLVLAPNNPVANYHMGWAYYETGEFEKARKFMIRALEIDPDFPGAKDARSLLGE